MAHDWSHQAALREVEPDLAALEYADTLISAALAKRAKEVTSGGVRVGEAGFSCLAADDAGNYSRFELTMGQAKAIADMGKRHMTS